MAEKYSLEAHYEVWNDSTGAHFKVGPDRDGLELVEVRQIDSDGREVARLTMDLHEVRLFATALIRTLKDMKQGTLDSLEKG